MKTLVRLMSVSSLALVGFVMPSIASADESQESSLGTVAQAMHEGKQRIFDNAIEAAQLRPDQKEEVDKLRSEWRDRHAPVKRAKSELMLAAADQIEQGKIDRCALAPQVKALATAKARTRPGDRAAMEKLHSILDKDQRARFVDSMRDQFDRMKKAHSTEALVDKMSKELDLREDQKAKLREIVDALRRIREASPEHAEHKARMRKILDAFKGEHFVLDEIAPLPKDLEQRIERRIDGRLWAGEAIIPVLDEHQRARLADRLRDKARHHGEKATGARGTEEEREQMEEPEEQQLNEPQQGHYPGATTESDDQ